jgi:hypothetical protein
VRAEQHRSQSLQDPGADRAGVPWDRALVAFMRLMAAVWVVKGLSYWLTILGVDPLGGPTFEALPPAGRAVVIVFAVLDLVASVGLWLTSTWGGVMWLLAIMSHILVGSFAPVGPQALGIGMVVAEGAAVIVYIILSWLAARDV